MLWFTMDTFWALEFYFYKNTRIIWSPALNIWQFLWVEWVVLQTLLLYTYYKLYSTVSYLRQVLSMMAFVIVLCLYLSVWQLELFSCFIFLGEFTILIFFYCLFLHLRALINQPIAETNNGSFISFSIYFILSIIAWMYYIGIIYPTINEISILFIDLFRFANDFILNDLVSLYYFFIAANISIHFLIGLTLFLLTIFLFIVVATYATLNLTRKALYRGTTMKLFTTKGYYEQSPEYSQKYFTNGNQKKE